MLQIAGFLILILITCSSLAADCPAVAPNCQGSNIFSPTPPGALPENNDILVNGDGVLAQVNQGWIPTGAVVKSGQAMNFTINKNSLNASPKKYLVIYKIDSRFNNQPVIIYQQQQSTAGNVTYNGDYQAYGSTEPQNLALPFNSSASKEIDEQVELLNQYFAMNNRGINVQQGDVVNVLLLNNLPASTGISNSNPGFYDLTTSSNFAGPNQLINITISDFCTNNNTLCSNKQYYITSNNLAKAVAGIFNFSSAPATLPPCTSNSSSYCYKQNGAGMAIFVGTSIAKEEANSFVAVTNKANSSNYVYSFVASDSGLLNFASPSINPGNAFSGFTANLQQNSLSSGPHYRDTSLPNIAVNAFQTGSYIMEVSVGSNAQNITSSINYNYTIAPIGSTPTGNGRAINNTVVADQDGAVWVSITAASSISGNAIISCSTYKGAQILSHGIYNYIVQPVFNMYQQAMKTIYTGLTNGQVQNYATMMAVIYILFYGIYFLLGAVEITAHDLLSRIIKIILVVSILFSGNSWNFFNQYLFNLFLNGTNEMINVLIVNLGDNPFAFLDPIFNQYTNPSFWISVLIQLCQFWTGIGFLALLVIVGACIFFASLLEIVMIYILSFILIAILIGLAPLFIPMILFSYTQEFVKNWLMLLLKSMLLPAILIFLALLFDQFMSNVLQGALLSSQWGCLAYFGFSSNIGGLDINVPGTICLPFYIPVVGDQTVVGDLTNYARNYLNIAIATFMYLTYSIIFNQIVGITDQILSVIVSMQQDNAIAKNATRIKNSTLGKLPYKASGYAQLHQRILKRAPSMSGIYNNHMHTRLQNTAQNAITVTGKAANKLATSRAASAITQLGKNAKAKIMQKFRPTHLGPQYNQNNTTYSNNLATNQQQSNFAAASIPPAQGTRMQNLYPNSTNFADYGSDTLGIKTTANFVNQASRDIAAKISKPFNTTYRLGVSGVNWMQKNFKK
jgi:type IV secretion system protein VirB6